MPIRYQLDTNIASFVIRDEPLVTRRFNSIKSEQIFISVITEAELLFGIARKPQATRLQKSIQGFLSGIKIADWNSAAAKHFAEERAMLERSGALLNDIDMMIAAHALAEDAILITNDVAFRRITHLKTEDWTI
jgi:tRNA(fMet)-specific endonuclease VapC